MPTNSGAKLPPVPNWPPPVDGENELPPTGVRGGAGACCGGEPSEGWSSWVPSVELVEERPGEPPARVPKTSMATLAAALRTVSTAVPTAAPAAVAPRLDGRRNATPTEAGTVGVGAEGVKLAAGATLLAGALFAGAAESGPVPESVVASAVASAVVGASLISLSNVDCGSGPPPSPRGATGSATSPRTSPASPESGGTCSEAAAGPSTGSTGSGAMSHGGGASSQSGTAGSAGAGAGSMTSGEAFGIGSGSSTRPKSVTDQEVNTGSDSTISPSVVKTANHCGAGCGADSGSGVDGAGSTGGEDGSSAGGVSSVVGGGGGAGFSVRGFSAEGVSTGGVFTGGVFTDGVSTGGVTPATGSVTLPLIVVVVCTVPGCVVWDGCSAAQASPPARTTKVTRHKTSIIARAWIFRLRGPIVRLVVLFWCPRDLKSSGASYPLC